MAKGHTPEQYRALLDRTFAEIRAKREAKEPTSRPLAVGQQRWLWRGDEADVDAQLVALPVGYHYVTTITRHQVELWLVRDA